MYPNFYWVFKEWFSWELPGLKLINTFGFMVAVSFIAAYLVMGAELRRKFKEGLIPSTTGKIVKGAAFPMGDYISSALFGFFIGFKLFPMLTDFGSIENDPQGFILSLEGNFLFGVLGSVLFAGYTYLADKKQRLKEPETLLVEIKPQENMGLFTMAAFIAGLLGAKLFHILENLSDFQEKPLASIFAFSGLTFYGGLICGGGMVLYYAWKKKIDVYHMLDVGAPAMILSYGMGRIGCHVSGDGDWGIVNKIAKPDWLGFLPDWFWAYNYPNNVNEVCNPYIRGTKEYAEHLCSFDDTPYLVDPVFPTPLYEAIVCIGLFFLIWSIRKKVKFPGALFGIYLILSGLERFTIEKIRVNTEMHFAGITFTQAELISLILIITGILLIFRKQLFSGRRTRAAT